MVPKGEAALNSRIVFLPVDGTACPILEGGITSSELLIGMSMMLSERAASTSLNLLFAGVASTTPEDSDARLGFLSSVVC